MDWKIRRYALDVKRRAFESLRIQISKMSGVGGIESRFSDTVSVNHLLSLILKQTLDVMNVRICIIWLKEKNGSFIARISFGLKTPLIRDIRAAVDSPPFDRVMRGTGPVSLSDAATFQEVPALRQLVKKEELHSILAAPLIIGDEKIGMLMVCTNRPHRFTDTEQKIFNALARQAALAIGNAGLYEKLDRKIREKIKKMSALFSMSRTITSSIDEGLIFDFIAEKTSHLMKANVCLLSLYDRSSERLALKASFGVDKARAAELEAVGTQFSDEALRTGRPCMINDLHTYFQKMPDIIREKRISSVIAMPLVGPKRRVGVIMVYMPDMRVFSKEDIEILEMVGSLCAMAIENMHMLERIKDDYLNTVKTLAKIIDANDQYTRGHCEKVMKYAVMISKELDLPPRTINAIKTASLLHDIGKIGIDITIVRKPGRLTSEERQMISHHSEIGARIVNQLGFLNDIVPIIRHHHERFAGGGYPDPEKTGADIPLGARILSVADAYDAMTSDRPYRNAMSKEEALRELKKCSNVQFDPKIVDVFLKTLSI